MHPDIFPMIVMVTAIVTTGGVLVLRPITKRLGNLLDVMAQQKMRQPATTDADVARIRELLTSIDSRITLLEERQDFAEALISANGEPRMLSSYNTPRAPERN